MDPLHLVFVDPMTGTINEVNEDTFLVEANSATLAELSDEELLRPGDNPHVSVIPLLENLNIEDEEAPPSFDDVEAAGFDGTLRDGHEPWTWEALAKALIAERNAPPPIVARSPWDTQPAVTLPPISVWYVRAMIARGIKALEDSIEECTLEAVNDSVPAWAKQSLEGAVAYNRQLLAEARQYIPGGLQ